VAAPTIIYSPVLEPELRAIADGVRPPGFELRDVPAATLPDALPEADFLCGFIGPLPTDLLVEAASKRLKLVQLMSVGYDRFNLDGARAARLPVAVNGGANAISVAEHSIMLMLMTLKHAHALNDAVHAGRWRDADVGRVHELYGATVGIVGMGRIGQEVAQRLAGWHAKLNYYDPIRMSPDREQALGVGYMELDALLRASDVVSLHVPLSDRTRGLIDAESLSVMKPSSVLINTARGGLIDEQALADALRSGRLAGAGLDVLSAEPPPRDHPLLGLPNVILTPHTAGPTWESFPRRFANCFANIERVQRGEKPLWVVEELSDLFT
jgi:phosphoglycerate dehydrogenase-like enzyme